MNKKQAVKLQKMYGPDHNDVSWVGERIYPHLPLVKRVWLRAKRIANYKIV